LKAGAYERTAAVPCGHDDATDRQTDRQTDGETDAAGKWQVARENIKVLEYTNGTAEEKRTRTRTAKG